MRILLEMNSKSGFMLNGIFSSSEKSYALINNQIARVGDKISGAVIKKITSEEVLFDFEGSEIKLSIHK